MTKIVVAVDDTEASVDAARFAHRVFGDDATYVVVHVADEQPLAPVVPVGVGVPVSPVYNIGNEVQPPATGRVGETDFDPFELAAAVARRVAADAGMAASEAVGAVGDPADAILEVAHGRDAELVVVGAHRHGWFTRTFGTSVADDVRRHADLPVLLVPERGRR